jgi:hypothetical protein
MLGRRRPRLNFFEFFLCKPLKRLETTKLEFGIIWSADRNDYCHIPKFVGNNPSRFAPARRRGGAKRGGGNPGHSENAARPEDRAKLGTLLAEIGKEAGGADLEIDRDRTPTEPPSLE